MDVKAWNGGGDAYGITVGKPNREEYFSKHWDYIFVEIDGQMHRFGLTPGFWSDCPEFRDKGNKTIREWLRKYKSLAWPDGQKPKARLVPLGGRKFRLEP